MLVKLFVGKVILVVMCAYAQKVGLNEDVRDKLLFSELNERDLSTL